MVARLRTVPAVSEQLIVDTAQLHAANPGQDMTVLMVTRLSGKYEPDDILHANFRMIALANFLSKNKGEPWMFKPPGESYTMVNEALYRAAAATPLSYAPDTKMANIHFDEKKLMEAALSKSDMDGNA
jgi:hypothetical protein